MFLTENEVLCLIPILASVLPLSEKKKRNTGKREQSVKPMIKFTPRTSCMHMGHLIGKQARRSQPLECGVRTRTQFPKE